MYKNVASAYAFLVAYIDIYYIGTYNYNSISIYMSHMGMQFSVYALHSYNKILCGVQLPLRSQSCLMGKFCGIFH